MGSAKMTELYQNRHYRAETGRTLAEININKNQHCDSISQYDNYPTLTGNTRLSRVRKESPDTTPKSNWDCPSGEIVLESGNKRRFDA